MRSDLSAIVTSHVEEQRRELVMTESVYRAQAQAHFRRLYGMTQNEFQSLSMERQRDVELAAIRSFNRVWE